MASGASSNSYYQENVYPLIADFLDDFGQEQKHVPASCPPLNSSVGGANYVNNTKLPSNPVAYGNDRLNADVGSFQFAKRMNNTSNPSFNSTINSNDLINSSSRDRQQNQLTETLQIVPKETSLHVTEYNSPSQSQLAPYDRVDDRRPNKLYQSSYDPSNNNSTLASYYGYDKKNELPPKVQKFKESRKIATAASAGTGIAVGAMIAGPVGMVVGGYGGYVVAKSIGKARERKMLEKCLNDEAGVIGANFKNVETAEMT